MIERIEVHNRLNGYAFVIVEFVLVVALIGGFGAYYATHGRALEAVIALGIAANALVIVLLCLRSVWRGERGVGLRRLYTDPAVKRQVMLANPRLTADTMLITGAVLVPFILVLVMVWTAIRRGDIRRSARSGRR